MIADGLLPYVYANNDWLTNHLNTADIPYDIWYERLWHSKQLSNHTIWQLFPGRNVDGINDHVTIELSFQTIVLKSYK